jgi:flagellar biosynthesis protein FlhG
MEGTVKFTLGTTPPLAETVSRSEVIPSSDESNTDDRFIPIDAIRASSPSRAKQIWAVGGGKGGVGKSLVASSLAIALARTGNRVVAVDLDLGGANLHTALGVDLPNLTLSDFVNHRVKDISNCIVSSGIPNLELISGAQDSIGITNMRPDQKVELLKKIRTVDADFLIFDLGAGTSFNTLDFFLFADQGFITLLPEPTSIENSYRFIKSAYYRHLMNSASLADIRPLIEMAMDQKNPLGIKSPADLFREVNKTNPEMGMLLKKQIDRFRPKLIVNQARTQTDIDIGASVRTVCKKYFGIDMEYIGHLDYDSAVWQSIRKKRPLMLEFPNSKIASSIEQVVFSILKPNGYRNSGIF